ncbi:unnamed protein product [Scytosiphon promiscuus]
MFLGGLGRRGALEGVGAAAARRSGKVVGVLRVLTTSGGPERTTSAPSGGKQGGAASGETLKSMGIGAGAGMLGSLVGMGGGFVAIPFLTGWLGLTQHQAHGTSLGAVFTTGAAGSTAYALAGHVDYQAAGAMAVAGMAAAHAGARCTEGVNGASLKLALGVLMLAVAPLLPLRDKLLTNAEAEVHPSDDRSEELRHTPGETDREGMPSEPSPREASGENVAKMFAIGAGSGFLAGVFGVGGGILTVPSISLATDLSHKEVLGTSLAAMVLPAAMGSATHFRQGNLVPRVALPLAVGTGVGAFLGGKFAARHLDENSLKLAFSFLMLALGTKTVVGARAAAAAAAKAAKASKRA